MVTQSVPVRTATWWYLDGKWTCVGAIRPFNKSFGHLSPEQGQNEAVRQGYKISGVKRHNPANPGALYGSARQNRT